MSEKESFEEFFEANFKIEYIADGDWNKITFCDQEFGMSYSPDYEIENFKRICETTWNHRQKKLDQAKEESRILREAVEFNKVFLAYALKDRYQWDDYFLKEVAKNIKALEKVQRGKE